MTLHLENEMNKSNGRLNTVVSDINGRLNTVVGDINSRKHDVIALVMKTEATNHQLKSLEVFMKNETHNLESNITNNMNKVSQRITAFERDMMNNVQHLQSGLNDTFLQLDSISNRAVLSAWSDDGTVASSAVIPFKQVHTAHGIHDLTSIRNKGMFTCEKPGLYLISVYVSTPDSINGYYRVFKNNEVLARVFTHPQSYMLTSTVIITERLQVNDTVYVENGIDMYVIGQFRSTFSIVQIE